MAFNKFDIGKCKADFSDLPQLEDAAQASYRANSGQFFNALFRLSACPYKNRERYRIAGYFRGVAVESPAEIFAFLIFAQA